MNLENQGFNSKTSSTKDGDESRDETKQGRAGTGLATRHHMELDKGGFTEVLCPKFGW